MKNGKLVAATAIVGWSLLVAFAVAGLAGCGGWHKAGDVKTITLPGGVKMEMVWCPPGTFMMGSPESEAERDADEEAQHRVTLAKGFWMAKYEVTQAQWKAVMGTELWQQRSKEEYGERMRTLDEGADYPMFFVNWNEAREFCEKAGNGLRLPTEEEWEYACRAGSTGPYAGTGNLDTMGWHDGSTANTVGSIGHANEWGLFDMHGNVAEWCEDLYVPRGTKTDWENDCDNPEEWHVARGGSIHSAAAECRSAYRDCCIGGDRYSFVGFRPCSHD